MVIEIQVVGADELEAALYRLPAVMSRWVTGPGCRASAAVILKNLKKFTPVKRGVLRDSSKARRVADNLQGRKIPGAGAIIFQGGVGARHAHLIEDGTVKMEGFQQMERAIRTDTTKQHAAFVQTSLLNFNRIEDNIRQGDKLTAGISNILDLSADEKSTLFYANLYGD